LLFSRQPDVREQSVIEPREGVNLPSSRAPRCRLLDGAAAETDDFVPPDRGCSRRLVNQGKHLAICLRNWCSLNLVIRLKISDRQIR